MSDFLKVALGLIWLSGFIATTVAGFKFNQRHFGSDINVTHSLLPVAFMSWLGFALIRWMDRDPA